MNLICTFVSHTMLAYKNKTVSQFTRNVASINYASACMRRRHTVVDRLSVCVCVYLCVYLYVCNSRFSETATN